jgi:hypothetical protein
VIEQKETNLLRPEGYEGLEVAKEKDSKGREFECSCLRRLRHTNFRLLGGGRKEDSASAGMFEQKDANLLRPEGYEGLEVAKEKDSKGREFGSRCLRRHQHTNFRLLGWKKKKERPGLAPLGTPIE